MVKYAYQCYLAVNEDNVCNTLQEIQSFLSKNDNRSISNLLLIKLNGWIIWGIFPLKNSEISYSCRLTLMPRDRIY